MLKNRLIPLMICLMKELTRSWKPFHMMMLEKLQQPHVVKKLIKRSSCDLCKQTLASQEVDLENDSYLKLLSLSGLFVPSRQLADFVCGSFAILDFLEKEIILFGMPVAKVATNVLKRYGSFAHFSCNMYHGWSFKFASKIVVNIFFNNKQKKKEGFG